MNWLLDTNVISELSKPAPDLKCSAWLEAHAEDTFQNREAAFRPEPEHADVPTWCKPDARGILSIVPRL